MGTMWRMNVRTMLPPSEYLVSSRTRTFTLVGFTLLSYLVGCLWQLEALCSLEHVGPATIYWQSGRGLPGSCFFVQAPLLCCFGAIAPYLRLCLPSTADVSQVFPFCSTQPAHPWMLPR